MAEYSELRAKAEAMAPGKAALTLESIEALPLDEVRRMLHDLQVHQIELQMQNAELRRAQAELEAARERYYAFYELAPAGYLTLSEGGTILEANLTTAALLGLVRDALISRPITRFIHKADQDIYSFYCKHLFATGEPQTCELRMLKNDGTPFWGHLAGTVAQNAAEAPVYRIILSDVSARQFRENARELISRLMARIYAPGDFSECMSELTASLQNWSGCEAVGIRLRDGDDYPYYETRGFPPAFVQAEKFLCAHGPDGEILRDGTGNPVLECMCGNVLCGRFDPVKPFFTDNGSFWSNSTTALLAGTTEADRQAPTRNRCNGMGYESVALIPLRAGDQTFGLLQFNDHRQNRFNHVLIAHFESMAEILAISLLQLQTVERLKESEDRFRSLYDSSPDAILLTAPDGRTFAANTSACRMFERTEAELKQIGRIGVVDPDDSRLAPALEERNRTGRFFGELTFVRKSGARFPGEISASVFTDKVGNTRTSIFIRDITDRKQADAQRAELESRSRQLQKAESLGMMAGAIAHNFNNHLQAIIGNLEMAMDGQPQGSDIYGVLSEAMKAARKAAQISAMMLTYKGQAPGKQTLLDLSGLCRQGLALLQAAAPDGEILNADFPASGPVIRGNAGQIQQVLTHLLTNAREAAGNRRGVIRLTVKTVSLAEIPAAKRFPPDWQPRDSVHACLEVADTGCGIAEKNIEKLFDPFFTTKFTGRGLGLPVVSGIVGAHGGGITVESRPDQGSIFRVFLPVSAEAIPGTAPKADKTPEIEWSGTVLVVEDEAQVRNMVKAMLTRLGFSVLEAGDGIAAVAVFGQRRNEIRFVICDLTMPRMNGWKTLAALRELSPAIPVILSSGYDEEQVMAGGHAELPQAFLGKPYRLNALRDTIRRVLFSAENSPHKIRGLQTTQKKQT